MWKERSERSDVRRGLNHHCCLEDGGRGRWPRKKVVSGGDDDPQLTAPKEQRSPCCCCMDLNPATTGMSLEQDAVREPPERNAPLWDSEQRSQPSPLDFWPLSVWPFITQQQETLQRYWLEGDTVPSWVWQTWSSSRLQQWLHMCVCSTRVLKQHGSGHSLHCV